MIDCITRIRCGAYGVSSDMQVVITAIIRLVEVVDMTEFMLRASSDVSYSVVGILLGLG